ncbi:MAG: hypothetical protein QE277_07695 [Flectobacillus sp.]|nr:hypothetical protein [Flectobacillus sp.]
MHKAVFNIDPKCILEETQEIFTPFINCYHIHSITLNVEGIICSEGSSFIFDGYKTKWLESGVKMESHDKITYDINYFYIKPDNITVLDFLIKGKNYSIPDKSLEIISKHYIEGQFSLDNGLYKNAVINFGTVVEGLLDKKLNHKRGLSDLIRDYDGSASKDDMQFITQLRNRVHVNNIHKNEDITRLDAINARITLERILCSLKDDSF